MPSEITYAVTETSLSSVANAIRTKGGTSAPLVFPNGFISAIESVAPNYNLYKAIANRNSIYASGTSSYTSQEVINFCDSIVSTNGGQFAGLPLNGSFTFTNLRTLETGTFSFVGGTKGIATFNFPALVNMAVGAFNQAGISEIYLPQMSYIPASCFISAGNFIISGPEVLTVNSSAFYGCTMLTNISFPKCVSISSGAFRNCQRLINVSLPNVEFIGFAAFGEAFSYNAPSIYIPKCSVVGQYAFASCSKLTQIDLPAVTTISSSAFYRCSGLLSVTAPNCTTIRESTFCYCSSLAQISFPNVVSIYSYAFQYCSSLTTANFPNCTTFSGYSIFGNCIKLTTASFPKLQIVDYGAFSYCTSLQTVYLSDVTKISQYAFYNCYNLISLYLTGVSSVPVLNVYNTAFGSTPLYNYSTSAGRWGSIFVPSSLYSSFITATGWTAISSRIVGV